jgi:hypothetical protein
MRRTSTSLYSSCSASGAAAHAALSSGSRNASALRTVSKASMNRKIGKQYPSSSAIFAQGYESSAGLSNSGNGQPVRPDQVQKAGHKLFVR